MTGEYGTHHPYPFHFRYVGDPLPPKESGKTKRGTNEEEGPTGSTWQERPVRKENPLEGPDRKDQSGRRPCPPPSPVGCNRIGSNGQYCLQRWWEAVLLKCVNLWWLQGNVSTLKTLPVYQPKVGRYMEYVMDHFWRSNALRGCCRLSQLTACEAHCDKFYFCESPH